MYPIWFWSSYTFNSLPYKLKRAALDISAHEQYSNWNESRDDFFFQAKNVWIKLTVKFTKAIVIMKITPHHWSIIVQPHVASAKVI